MPYIPPPVPPTPEEIERRWFPGATLKDLDPELYRWHRQQRRMLQFEGACVLFGCAMLLGMAILIAVKGLAA